MTAEEGALAGDTRQGRVLIVKMSSLGDVAHTLPALTDIRRYRPELTVDWVVEEDFAFIPALHPGLAKVIPVAIRRWRHAPFGAGVRREFMAFREALQAQAYDAVIDAQGLIKSALVARLAIGRRWGPDRASVRESLASLLYQEGVSVPHDAHAVDRTRSLFAACLNYEYDARDTDYGLRRAEDQPVAGRIMFVHGTTWPSKHWPEAQWRTLAEAAVAAGYRPVIPHWGEVERRRAETLADGLAGIEVLPRMALPELVDYMRSLDGVIAVDTGLLHLAAALEIPAVGLFGPTNPARTGNHGSYQRALVTNALACTPCLRRTCTRKSEAGSYPPCFMVRDPRRILDVLEEAMGERRHAQGGTSS